MKIKILTLALIIAAFSTNAQWTQTNGPYGGSVTAFAVIGSNLFAAADKTVFISSDNGTTWSKTGLQNAYGSITSLVSNGTHLVAGIDAFGVFISSDNGTNWTSINDVPSVNALAVSGSNVFAGTGGGPYLSTDNGANWTAVNNGLTQVITALAVKGSNIFAGTNSGVFLSSNNGTSWTSVNTGLTNTEIKSLVVSGTKIFAGMSGGGVFVSANNGTLWTSASIGLPNETVNALAVNGTTLFAGTSKGNGVYRSTDSGAHWTAVNNGITNVYYILSFGVNGSDILAGLAFGGVCRSSDNGDHWTPTSTGLPNSVIVNIQTNGSNIFAGTYGNGVALSSDNGASWASINEGLTNNDEFPYVDALLASGTELFASMKGTGPVHSTNNGTDWAGINIPVSQVRSWEAFGSDIFAGTGNGIYHSTNSGSTWVLANTGVAAYTIATSFTKVGSNIIAGTNLGIYRSTNNGSSWTAMNTGLPAPPSILDLAVIGTNIFASSGGGVLLSTNNGSNWTAVNSGLTDLAVSSLAVAGTDIYAGTTGGYVFISTNNGTSWTSTGWPLGGNSAVYCLAATPNNLFAGANSGVWKLSLVTCIPDQPGAITGNAIACLGSSNGYSIASVTGATSYTWTLPAGWTGSSTTNSITATAGSTGGNISVTANNTCGASQPQTFVVTGIPNQPVGIDGNSDACSGMVVNYSISAVVGASSYGWTLPNNWTGTSTTVSIAVTPDPSSGTVSVVATNSCGSSSPQTLSVLISSTPPAMPGPISGVSNYCSGRTNAYSISTVSGASFYTWSIPIGWNGSPSTTTTINPLSSSNGGDITVIANNGCGFSAPQTLAVTANDLAPAGPISGNLSICSGSTNDYSINAISGADGYYWVLPGGWSGSSTTTTISTISGSESGYVSVSGFNVCGSWPSQDLLVTVTAPAKPVITVNMANLEAPILSTPSADNYQWYVGGIPAGNSQTLEVTSPGVFTVEVTMNSCPSPLSDPFPIIVTGDLHSPETRIMKVYPNPGLDRVTIFLGGFEDSRPVIISVVDIKGQVIEKMTGLGQREVTLELRNYAVGKYIISAQQNALNASLSFIKLER